MDAHAVSTSASHEQAEPSPAPFLFAFCEEPATEGPEGTFDRDTDLWVVDVGARSLPLVLMGVAGCGTETITRIRTETTDED